MASPITSADVRMQEQEDNNILRMPTAPLANSILPFSKCGKGVSYKYLEMQRVISSQVAFFSRKSTKYECTLPPLLAVHW